MVDILVEEDGLERREAEVCLRDGDLFPLSDPGSLYPFEGEEAFRQWQEVREMLFKLYEWFAEFTRTRTNPPYCKPSARPSISPGRC